ncbi:UvrD-helicase domain-containing protein [Cohnella cholangitidis]|uniref:AAA family ATPase n=1 Tax=Cohnella cholangitidis TaxID=2598458 RepID=A0A7G5C472_9BACL|nr:UvrD-helicase domain-containing protein [Cohnella cholangitidis]QMV44006.1 AAA family ATPase [Cohnella cholangitidis]
MKIVVAGAGAGKTTSMAKVVMDRLKEVVDGKMIYVVTYTNAARDRIRDLINKEYGSIPKNLHVETSHAFLLREVIFPFHHLVFVKHFKRVSHISLPDNPMYRAKKIRELENRNIIHVEKVTEIAKWVLSRKSNDNKLVRERRVKILSIISRYLDSVYVDEAQDMDDHFVDVINSLNNQGIITHLIGDPKQDLRGRNSFRQLVHAHGKDVEFLQMNYRCPTSHVTLSNIFVPKLEEQKPHRNANGELGYLFESDITPSELINKNDWNLVYILKKNERYLTHSEDRFISDRNLLYELEQIIGNSKVTDDMADRVLYVLTKKIFSFVSTKNNFEIFDIIENDLNFTLSRQDKGKLRGPLEEIRNSSARADGIIVRSIDSVKGLEGSKCLLILTTDLAAYLFGEKTEYTKTMNYLYVALTRAQQILVFLITKEVENKYTKSKTERMLENLLISKFTVNYKEGMELKRGLLC